MAVVVVVDLRNRTFLLKCFSQFRFGSGLEGVSGILVHFSGLCGEEAG